MSGRQPSTVSTRDVAREVVLDFAPDEASLFDQLWDDLSRDTALPETQGRKHDHALGSGAVVETTMMSLIIIPLVIEVAKAAVGATIKTLIDFAVDDIKRRLGKPGVPPISDEAVQRIAQAVAEQVSRKRR